MKGTFHWTPECDRAFQKMKQQLTVTPILGYPTADDPFMVDTDARWLPVRDKSARNRPGLRHCQDVRKATPSEEQSPAPPPRKKAKLAKQGTASTAVKGKSKQPSKTKRKGNNLPPPPPKPRKENDKFVMEVGSQPPPPPPPPRSLSLQQTTNLPSNLPSKQLVPVNSQPVKSLLRDLQSQQLVPTQIIEVK